MRLLIAAIHGIMTGQTSTSWPDHLDAWMWRRHPEVKVLKKEYLAGPFPRWNCLVKNVWLARSLANEMELLLGEPPITPGVEDAQNFPPPWFVAHSNGAVIALLVTQRLIARGYRVGGLILTGAACEADLAKNGVLSWLESGALGVALAYASAEDAVLAGDPRVATTRWDQARTRAAGTVSDACAEHLAALFIQHCTRSGCLDAVCSVPAQRDVLASFARNRLQLTTRAALGATEIPLPSQYGGELRELISEFGVVRRRMAPYPIGMGTARPARMGTRPAFGSIAMSGLFTEKTPKFSFASLESHKIGGIVRLPRELDEQSIVPLGQFLARFDAVEFARAEDQWGFLADGSGSYESVKGIVQVARDASRIVTLAATKTKPSDVTLDDLRALRLKVNKAALNGRVSAYYLDSTWEARLPAFRTAAEPNVYLRLPDGSSVLDGYPIVWTDVLPPYSTDANPNAAVAVFGALSFWWMGEHGTPRIDTSEHVWFANDQLAVRFIEEIDFDYVAEDATAALITATV